MDQPELEINTVIIENSIINIGMSSLLTLFVAFPNKYETFVFNSLHGVKLCVVYLTHDIYDLNIVNDVNPLKSNRITKHLDEQVCSVC